MYLYFVDKMATEKGSTLSLPLLESRLVELGITGRIEKMSMFKDARALIAGLIKEEGLHTIVAVGNDDTFLSVFHMAAEHDNLTIGYVPCDPQSRMATLLDYPSGIDACANISKRLTRTVDIGRVQGAMGEKLFFGAIELPASARVHCDQTFNIQCDKGTVFSIENVGRIAGLLEDAKPSNYTDGKIEVVAVLPPKKSWFKRTSSAEKSTFYCDLVQIDSAESGTEALLDESQPVPLPITVTTANRTLKIIVGKNAKL